MRSEKKNHNKKMPKSSNPELNATLNNIEKLLSKIEAGVGIKYIEYIGYAHSLKKITKEFKVLYCKVIISVLVCEYSLDLLPSQLYLNTWASAAKLSKALSNLYALDNPKFKKSLETLGYKTISNLKNLISTGLTTIENEKKVKINLLSKIYCMINTTSFELALSAFRNISDSCIYSYIFPSFTSNTKPYLPQYMDKSFTLVLDLDETLAHVNEGKVFIRPGALEFIKEMSLCYELVLFTAAKPAYADLVMSQLDPEGIIKLRLYRNHATCLNGLYIKNLEDLGRDLNKVFIVDNLQHSFTFQPNNGICIKTWTRDPNDCKLLDLAVGLKNIFDTGIQNVSEATEVLNKICA